MSSDADQASACSSNPNVRLRGAGPPGARDVGDARRPTPLSLRRTASGRLDAVNRDRSQIGRQTMGAMETGTGRGSADRTAPGRIGLQPPTDIPAVTRWVNEVAALAAPEAVHWCDGPEAEYQSLCDT